MSELVEKSMVTVTLPDGSERRVEAGTSVIDFAASIGAGLAQATVGARFNGEEEISDLRTPIKRSCSIEIVTSTSEAGLHVIRHSASHIMADAICRLWPDAKLSIGPSTATGFYYDIDLEHRIADDDLEKIEATMKEIIAEGLPFERCDVAREASLERFRNEGEIYKVELIEGFPEDEAISTYKHGNFEDLCRGPHVPHTGYIKAFKILNVAGAYWRGDEKRAMLQRIYGTAFSNKKDLKKHLHNLEEARKRDHRKLGKELKLFCFDQVAPAMPFFMPKGARVYNMLRAFIVEKYERYGYDEVITPQVLDVELWKRSGHWDKYQENMFFTKFDKAEFGVKPMNCPCHAVMYSKSMYSYRDLPIRMADFGRLHRYERSGVTSGLTRVRSFCQDDAHVFCRDDQIGAEISAVIEMLREVYDTFEFPKTKVYLSTRPEKSVGSDEVWAKAEAGLAEALAANDIDYEVNAGDGAFYGPKIDFVVLDAIGREWQLGTVQLDFNMPERFDLDYVNAEGGRSRPVMVHRAILGSLERFFGIIIEHYAGEFPVWLAPVQVKVATISEKHLDYAERVAKELQSVGIRVEKDFDSPRIGAKIRDARNQRIPYIAIIGDREAEESAVSLKTRKGDDLGTMSLESFRDMIVKKVVSKESTL